MSNDTLSCLDVNEIFLDKTCAVATSKWKQPQYQRSARAKRSREGIDSTQALITDFFTLADVVCKTIGDSTDLCTKFTRKFIITATNNGTTDDDRSNKIGGFLRKLLDISQKNLQGPCNKHYFDSATKKFAIYVFYVGGRLLYETLYANMPKALPSITTLNRFVADNRTAIEEGEFDFKGLSMYLEKINLERIIWIAEDATRVKSKIEYNSNTNKVVGFVLPLENGIPIKDKFVATSAKKIKYFFNSGVKSHYAYVITAQPLSSDSPAYCLCIFGTDNKFTAEDVCSRWKYLKKTAEEFGITIMGFSSAQSNEVEFRSSV